MVIDKVVYLELISVSFLVVSLLVVGDWGVLDGLDDPVLLLQLVGELFDYLVELVVVGLEVDFAVFLLEGLVYYLVEAVILLY